MDNKPMLIMVLLLVGAVAGVIVFGTHKPVVFNNPASAHAPIQPKPVAGKVGVVASSAGATVAPAVSSAAQPTGPVTESALPEPAPVATPSTPAIQERKPLIPGPDETDDDPVPAPAAVKK